MKPVQGAPEGDFSDGRALRKSSARTARPGDGQEGIAMKKVIGATAGLLILVGPFVPAGQSVSAASWDCPKGTVSTSSWDWPK